MTEPFDLDTIDTARLGGRRIVLADDNEQNLELLSAYLDGFGCELSSIDQAEEVIDTVRRVRPDVVVLDVMMPRLSGFQICERLKADAETAGIPILVVTALGEVADVERAKEAGADAFLTKPVGKAELIEHIVGLLGGGPAPAG